MDNNQSLKELQIIPGVGKSIAQDFLNIGIRKISDLKGQDPQKLYEKICKYQGGHVDRCVLYVCRSSVYFAEHKNPDPEKLKWWNWKDRKK
jgi:nucleotidyltransferase/DNA polymerase involved in DNA repair